MKAKKTKTRYNKKFNYTRFNRFKDNFVTNYKTLKNNYHDIQLIININLFKIIYLLKFNLYY